MHASFYILKYIIKFNTKSHKLLNEAGRGIKNPKESYLDIVCLCWGFTAQSTQWGHVKRGQFI